MQAKVSATPRDSRGKNAARRLRAEGLIPAVAYGKGEEAVALAVSPDEVKAALFSDYGVNVVVELEVQGQTKVPAMIAEYQYHPLSRELLHADFVKVSDSHPVTVEVPLELTGRSKGIVMGGKLRQVFRTLPVRCVPSKIPVRLSHDITNIELEQNVAVSDLALPEGVEVLLPAKRTVASVGMDRRAKKDEEGAEEKK